MTREEMNKVDFYVHILSFHWQHVSEQVALVNLADRFDTDLGRQLVHLGSHISATYEILSSHLWLEWHLPIITWDLRGLSRPLKALRQVCCLGLFWLTWFIFAPNEQTPWTEGGNLSLSPFAFLDHPPWTWSTFVCIPHLLNKPYHFLKVIFMLVLNCLLSKKQGPRK